MYILHVAQGQIFCPLSSKEAKMSKIEIPCPNCGRKFSNPTDFANHRLNCGTTRRYVEHFRITCLDCGKTNSVRGDMDNFTCSKCGARWQAGKNGLERLNR